MKNIEVKRKLQNLIKIFLNKIFQIQNLIYLKKSLIKLEKIRKLLHSFK